MPNRIIKESICVSEQIDELTAFEENFFYRLLVNCDDYGCMDAREKVLAAKLYPLKRIREKDILNALDSLARISLICLYEVENHPYLKVIKWADHQRVRVSKHKYPEPTDEQIAAGCGDSRQVAASCGKMRPESNPIQSNPNPNPNTNPNPNPNPSRGGGGGKRGGVFSIFWEKYPRKIGKLDARKAWDKLDVGDVLMDEIMSGLERWLASDQWNRDNGRYIPYPASWLNGRRWEDEVRPYQPEEKKQSPTVSVASEYHQRDYSDEQEAAFRRMMEMEV